MTTQDTGQGGPHAVCALWVRPQSGGPMVDRDTLSLHAFRGIEGDHSLGRRRHVTIVFEDDWNAAAAELGLQVDPVGRRANVLVSGGGGPAWVGRTIRLGTALVEVLGITEPCDVMERAATGLRDALKPDGRAGVWGRVLEDGAVRLGDALTAGRPGERPSGNASDRAGTAG